MIWLQAYVWGFMRRLEDGGRCYSIRSRDHFGIYFFGRISECSYSQTLVSVLVCIGHLRLGFGDSVCTAVGSMYLENNICQCFPTTSQASADGVRPPHVEYTDQKQKGTRTGDEVKSLDPDWRYPDEPWNGAGRKIKAGRINATAEGMRTSALGFQG